MIKYGIIGTGALGGFYGGMLARSGCDVSFIARSDAQFIRDNGLRVDSVKGNFHLNPVKVFGPDDQFQEFDVILVTLKSTQNKILERYLPAMSHKGTLVITLQNGLGVEEDLSSRFPDLQIAGGVCYICSTKIGPGHINHLDLGSIKIGSFQKVNLDLIQKVADDFKGAGVEASYTDNLVLNRWMKLVWNIPFNGMSVVLNTTTEEIMANQHTRVLMRDLMREVIYAAKALKVPLHVDECIDQMFEITDHMIPYAPSMKIDFDQKRAMEIEYIYTRPLEMARSAGIEMPGVAMLEKQLHFIQSTYLP